LEPIGHRLARDLLVKKEGEFMTNKVQKAVFILGLGLTLSSQAAEVKFIIPPGTAAQNSHWNSELEPLEVQVGDTLIIINGDSEPHRLHSLGVPCEHGEEIAPGHYEVCQVKGPYDSRLVQDPIHDHMNPEQIFWLVVNPK
jgi:hypothetical protein